MAYGVYVALVLVVSMHLTHGDVSSCSYTDKSSGKTYDFSTLVNP